MSTLTTTTAGPVTDSVDYGELSAAELAKLINDEYGLVLASERNNLNRAKTIGEKLDALRAGTQHGEWQKKLAKWCPKLSYETANRYIKVYVRWPEIEKAAAAKSVKATDLTIDTALKLLATPKTDSGANANTKKGPTKATKAAVEEPATDPASKSQEDIAKQYLGEVWAPAELVAVLKEVRDDEYLAGLSAALAKALKPELAMPPAVQKPEGEIVRHV
jgi:hypothetical protein